MEERKSNNGTVELRCHLSDIRIEQREGDTGGRTVTGYAAKFESWSEPICGWFVEQIRRGAFDECDTSDAILPHGGMQRKQLPVNIGCGNHIVIHQNQRTDPASRQSLHHIRSDSPQTEYRHLRFRQQFDPFFPD